MSASKLILALSIVWVTANWSYAEEQSRGIVDVAVNEIHALAPQTGISRTAPPGGRTLHCCNKKGALIGAAVGTVFGLWVAHYCDYDCTAPYIGAASLFGGIGAAIGAFVLPASSCRRCARFSRR